MLVGEPRGTAGPVRTAEGLAGVPQERMTEASRCGGNQACFLFTAAVFSRRWMEVDGGRLNFYDRAVAVVQWRRLQYWPLGSEQDDGDREFSLCPKWPNCPY